MLSRKATTTDSVRFSKVYKVTKKSMKKIGKADKKMMDTYQIKLEKSV